MSADLQNMMQWLAHEMVQGIAFDAGSTFDPPHEITDHRLAPDISLGGGHVPLNKSTFPTAQTPALAAYHPENIFPSSVLFPNLAVHLRAGLPGRMDFAIRGADMTTPPGYKISPNTGGVVQSNSIGFSLRKHVLGYDDMPLVSFGANYNHVYGRFLYNTTLNINTNGFSTDAPVNGAIVWNVNSFGLNAVASQTFGKWTPFLGVGYNYVTGSIRTSLQAVPDTALIDPIKGEASDHPEQNNARVVFGWQHHGNWVHAFTNGEVKAIGIGAGKTWVMQTGLSLPFHIGTGGGNSKADSFASRKTSAVRDNGGRRELTDNESEALARVRAKRRSEMTPHKEMFGGSSEQSESSQGTPTMIFIQ
jgi:hypothetical protein